MCEHTIIVCPSLLSTHTEKLGKMCKKALVTLNLLLLYRPISHIYVKVSTMSHCTGAHGRFVPQADKKTQREARIQTLEPSPWMWEVEKFGHATRKADPLTSYMV